MLETKCVGDNIEMLATILAVFVTNILYLLTSVGQQLPKDVTYIEIHSLTSKNCHQDKVTNIYVAKQSWLEMLILRFFPVPGPIDLWFSMKITARNFVNC